MTKPNLPAPALTILHKLLDRWENRDPESARVVRVRLPKDVPDYASHPQRAEVHATLLTLAEAGTIELRWERHHEDNWLEAIDLRDAVALYARLHRTPRANHEAALHALLAAQTPHADWQARFLAQCQAQLAAHKSVAPLTLTDAEHNHALLVVLDAIAQLTEPTLERVLSVRTLSDSKRFDALRGEVVRVLRQFSPQAEALGDDDQALLAAHFVERAPEYVPLAGPLTLRLAEGECACAPFAPSLALPASLIHSATVAACEATMLVTVENATSFIELCRARPPEVLVVFTGGFASPTVIHLLQLIQAFRPQLPLYHWGDLDAGGLRILRHLRQALPRLRPWLMTASLLNLYAAHSQPLTPTNRSALATLQHDPNLVDCQSLIAALLETDCKLEQEALPVTHIRQALAEIR